ncbi:MAG: tripartite tricarboxylate transporter TctB family protein [Pseudolysinimonas sp.]|uniref:tripartite tricarboxylate transporter TctB family protein n=1 Tax=Pseudolysinimonas sp. TaxID=2680009 RepID=UPI003C70CD1E
MNATTPWRLGLVATSILTLVGVAAAIVGATYGVFGDDGRVGPGFLPTLTASVVAVCGGIDVVFRLRARRRSASADAAVLADEIPPAEPDATDDAVVDDLDIFGRSGRQRTRMLFAVLGIVMVALLLVPIIGFLPAFAIVLVGCSFFVERRKLLPSLLVSGTALVAAYLIFGVFLRVPLPVSILGI